MYLIFNETARRRRWSYWLMLLFALRGVTIVIRQRSAFFKGTIEIIQVD